MSKIKLNLRGLSDTELVVKARHIADSLTNNPNYTTPPPPIAQLTTAANEAEAANAGLQTAKQTVLTTTIIAHEKTDALISMVRQTAAYVESVAGDDDKKIATSGFTLRSATFSIPAVTAPNGLSATAGDHEGEIDLSWDKVKGAKSYIIERSPDPPSANSWAHQTVALKSSATIEGLTSGTRYWFRVAAVLTGGQSAWSDPAIKMAP